jgi:ABC-type sugar transport system substrate-binding protein
MGSMERRLVARVMPAAVGVLLVATAAACGDDSSGSKASSTSAATTASSAASTTAGSAASSSAASTAASTAASSAASTTVAPGGDVASKVKALLAGNINFPRPDTPVTPGVHKVAIVSSGQSSPGPSRVADEITQALKVIGWTSSPVYDGQFKPTEQAAGVQAAVNDKADAIFLIAITPSAVAAPVKAAQAAKIPILCILCGPDPITEGITNIQADSKAAGEAQAMYAMANAKSPNPTIIVYHNDEFQFSSQQMNAAEAYLKQNCTACKLESSSLRLAESRDPNAPIWVNMLRDHPQGQLDFVLLPFDSPANALSVTAQQLGRSDFGVIGYGALSPFVDAVGAGSPPVAKASVTISTPYFGWAAVDEAARVLAGKPTWKADSMPVGLITKDNFSRFPKGAPYEKPDFDFTQFFSKMWGK